MSVAFWDDYFGQLYNDSDNGHVIIGNNAIEVAMNSRAEDDFPWTKIAYLENGWAHDGYASSTCGCLKRGWLVAAQELAKSSGDSVTLSLFRCYSDSMETHKIEVAPGRAKVTCVSKLGTALETVQFAKLSVKDAAELLADLQKLIFTIELV